MQHAVVGCFHQQLKPGIQPQSVIAIIVGVREMGNMCRHHQQQGVRAFAFIKDGMCNPTQLIVGNPAGETPGGGAKAKTISSNAINVIVYLLSCE